jgi:hypothetical protein
MLMRPVTQYLKPETKDPEAEVAILNSAPRGDHVEEENLPKTDASAANKEQQNSDIKNGSVVSETAVKLDVPAVDGGEETTPAVKKQLCSCCLPARKCLICRIFLMINWRLLLDCNFVIIALGKINFSYYCFV